MAPCKLKLHGCHHREMFLFHDWVGLVEMHVYFNIIPAQRFFLHTDPVLLEITVQYLEEKVHEIEAVQKTTMLRLHNIEKLIQGQESQRRIWHHHPGEHSWQPGSENFSDSDCWQIHHPFASAYPQHTQTTQPQLTSTQHPQMTQQQFTSAQHQYTQPPQTQFSSPLAGAQRNWNTPLSSSQPHFSSPLDQPHFTPRLSCTSQGGTSSQEGSTSSLPKAKPICPKLNTSSLSSCEIDKNELVTTDVFFQRHQNLKGESRAGMLSVKLAREVYFGKKVMGKCTVSGCRDLPGLPIAELDELKQLVFMQFPQFWKSPMEFEPLWVKCIEAINQSCKKIRQKSFT